MKLVYLSYFQVAAFQKFKCPCSERKTPAITTYTWHLKFVFKCYSVVYLNVNVSDGTQDGIRF
jgi:hypothetical protein